jgi:branched-chain amino acid transport system ATP-binding protein
VLDQTGLRPSADLPAGRLTLLDRKRLELARALATAPRVLLLDEIAGGLTDAESHALVDTIRAVRQASNVAIVWIEHVLHALMPAISRLVVLNFGRKLAEGEPHAVLASEAVRTIYLGIDDAPEALGIDDSPAAA